MHSYSFGYSFQLETIQQNREPSNDYWLNRMCSLYILYTLQ